MAQKVIVHRIDDLTGQHGEDVELIEFGIDGVDYEIDLSAHNADKLRDALAGHIRVARKKAVTPSTRSSTPKDAKADAAARKERIKSIREWAEGKFDLSERGRLPLAVEQAYDKAMDEQNGTAPAPEVVVEAEVVEASDRGAVPAPAFSG